MGEGNVLPEARDNFRQPPQIYAYNLEAYGIDLPPEQLIARARRGFYGTRKEMEIAGAPGGQEVRFC